MVKLLPTIVNVGTALMVYAGCEPLIVTFVPGLKLVDGTFKTKELVAGFVTDIPPPVGVITVVGVTGITIVLLLGPDCKVLPVNESAGVMFTELPFVILSVPGAKTESDCAVVVGKRIVFVGGPTVKVLPLTPKLGAIATLFPPLILILPLAVDKLGVEAIV